MTYEQIAGMIEEIGYPCNYYQFPPGQASPPPFVVFWFPESANFMADNKNYSGIKELRIELYTDNKDFEAEAAVEEVLKKYEIPYQSTEMYIDDEQLFEVVYESEVLING